MADAAPRSETLQTRTGTFLLVVVFVGGLAVIPRIFGGGLVSLGQSPLVGKPAPAFSLPVVANGAPGKSTIALADFKGSPVVLDFWATWCGPCKAEAPIVNAIANRFHDQGLAVVGINTSDRAGVGGPWATAHHLTYPIAFDEGSEAAGEYNVTGMPTLVVISRTGEIIAVREGVTDADELESLVRKAL